MAAAAAATGGKPAAGTVEALEAELRELRGYLSETEFSPDYGDEGFNKVRAAA